MFLLIINIFFADFDVPFSGKLVYNIYKETIPRIKKKIAERVFSAQTTGATMNKNSATHESCSFRRTRCFTLIELLVVTAC